MPTTTTPHFSLLLRFPLHFTSFLYIAIPLQIIIRARLIHSLARFFVSQPNNHEGSCNNSARSETPERHSWKAKRTTNLGHRPSTLLCADLTIALSSQHGRFCYPGPDERVQVGPHPSAKATGKVKSGRTTTITPHRLTEGGSKWQCNWRWKAKEVGVCEESSRHRPRHISHDGQIRETGTTYGSLKPWLDASNADNVQSPRGKRYSMTGLSKSTS